MTKFFASSCWIFRLKYITSTYFSSIGKMGGRMKISAGDYITIPINILQNFQHLELFFRLSGFQGQNDNPNGCISMYMECPIQSVLTDSCFLYYNLIQKFHVSTINPISSLFSPWGKINLSKSADTTSMLINTISWPFVFISSRPTIFFIIIHIFRVLSTFFSNEK